MPDLELDIDSGSSTGAIEVDDSEVNDGAEELADESEVEEVDDDGEQPESDDDTEDEPEQPLDPKAEKRKKREQLAAAHGLDINNPAHRKLIDAFLAQEKRIADGQEYIEKLRGGTQESDEMFSELESLFDETAEAAKPQQAEQPKPEQPKPAGQPAAQMDYGDGFAWQSPEDAYNDHGLAWARVNADIEAGRKPDYQSVLRVDNAMFERRRLHSMPQIARELVPVFRQMLDEFRQRELEPVLPRISEALRDREFIQARESVMGAIAKTKGADMFREMMTPEGKGHVTTPDGDRVPDTPFNRIMAANPSLLKIEVRDSNGKIDHKRTIHEQYLAAMRTYAAQRQKPAEAKKLVQAGQQIQKQQQSEKARQTINAAGKTPRSARASGGGQPRELSVSDFFNS